MIVADPEPWNLTYNYRTDKNQDIDTLTAEFKLTSPSKCNITYYELRANPLVKFSGNTFWSSWITINSTTGVVSVNHNDYRNISTNLTFSVYVTAVTLGLKTGSKEVIFNVLYPYVNSPPEFVSSPSTDMNFKIDGEEQLKGYNETEGELNSDSILKIDYP